MAVPCVLLWEHRFISLPSFWFMLRSLLIDCQCVPFIWPKQLQPAQNLVKKLRIAWRVPKIPDTVNIVALKVCYKGFWRCLRLDCTRGNGFETFLKVSSKARPFSLMDSVTKCLVAFVLIFPQTQQRIHPRTVAWIAVNGCGCSIDGLRCCGATAESFLKGSCFIAEEYQLYGLFYSSYNLKNRSK